MSLALTTTHENPYFQRSIRALSVHLGSRMTPTRRGTRGRSSPASGGLGSVRRRAATGGAPVCATGTPLYPFSSLFNSLKKRQSVPSARIFAGLALIIPTSCRRRA
jgi:hypothetical protein